MGSSLISTAFVLLMFGGCGAYYYFVVYKKMMSPEARAAAFAAAGYRPGETVQASFGGLLLRRDASGGFMEAVMDLRRGGTATHVFSNITTHDRLHLTIGIGSAAQNVMFEANARPTIRVQGRVFLQDTTGIGDMLMDVTKTTLYWVADGHPQPPSTVRRGIYNQVGQEEPSCVIEVAGLGQPPLYYETYDTAVQALLHWASRGAQLQHTPPGYAQPPQTGYPQQQQQPGYPQPQYGTPPQGSGPPPGGYPRS